MPLTATCPQYYYHHSLVVCRWGNLDTIKCALSEVDSSHQPLGPLLDYTTTGMSFSTRNKRSYALYVMTMGGVPYGMQTSFLKLLTRFWGLRSSISPHLSHD